MITALNACSRITQPIKFLEVEEPYNYDTDPCSPFVNCARYLINIERIMQRVRERKYDPFINLEGLQQEEKCEYPDGDFLVFCTGAVAIFNKCDFKEDRLKIFTASLKRCATLSKLYLHACRNIPETFFSLLEANTSLTHLVVINNDRLQQTFSKLIAKLKHLKNLKVLALEGMFLGAKPFAAAFMSSMKKLQRLESLSLHECFLEPQTVMELMKILTKCPLERLELSNNSLSGVYHDLSRIPTVSYQCLVVLGLSGVLRNDDILGLARMIDESRLPVLKIINMEDNYELVNTDGALEILAQTCERIFKRAPCRVKVPGAVVGEKLRKERYNCLQYAS